MTPEQYTKVIEERPELGLPHYWQLAGSFIIELDRMSPEDLIAKRIHAIIARDDHRKPNESTVTIGKDTYTIV